MCSSLHRDELNWICTITTTTFLKSPHMKKSVYLLARRGHLERNIVGSNPRQVLRISFPLQFYVSVIHQFIIKRELRARRVEIGPPGFLRLSVHRHILLKLGGVHSPLRLNSVLYNYNHTCKKKIASHKFILFFIK
jgi:hypothetical protein